MRLGASILLLVLALFCVAQGAFAQEAPPTDLSTSSAGGTIKISPNDLTSEDASLKTDYMRASGRFGYTLPDGRFVPAGNVRIEIYRTNNPFGSACRATHPGELAYRGYLDPDGYFDVTFGIPRCDFCTERNIFVRFSMATEFTGIARDPGGNCDDIVSRWFDTPTAHGVGPGDHIDFGTQQPVTREGNAMVHALVSQAHLMEWLNGLGFNPGGVLAWWDEPPTTSGIITPEDRGCDPASCDNRMQVGTDDWFNDYAIARLTARCWALNNLTKPSLLYCNGICDGAGCSYCLWCTEEEAVAYWEGALAWMAVSALKIVDSSRIYRTIQIDALDGCGVGPQNPLGTPGFFAAALRDIADPDYDNHPEYPGVRDLLSESDQHVMDVIRLDQPTTPMEFFADFKNRWPVTCAALWETAANCGYDIDVIGPGVVQGGVTSTSHLANVPSPNAIVDVEWGTPNDDCSGIGGYSVSATQDVPVLPDAIADLGPVNSWRTDVLASGTWWVNVRAVDASGRWSGVYASFGPVIIENPTPANLTHVARTGWSDPVVPRPAADAGSTNVPAPTSLPGNSAGTYWNSSISNVGYQSTGTGSGTWIFADGSGFYNPLNPVDHADAVPVLDALESYQSLNLGPIQVKGGRHTFGAIADFVGEIAEDDELDNGWAKSWVWTPLQVALGGSVYRLAPPDRIGGWEYDPVSGYYNCDGLRFTQSPDSGTDAGYWNALTLVPADDEVDYDARLHLASTGADNGFRAYSGYSSRPAGCTDAVFVNYNQNSNANWDVGIVQTTNPPTGASYEARHVRSTYFNYGTQTVVT
ncbi:MAG TPA: hypothetical protein VKA63_11755, partial [Candidatus Krumholzibacteria bacterium]|nr:hypothetical protein [Candidatus Krumholzibacteria bacterium]